MSLLKRTFFKIADLTPSGMLQRGSGIRLLLPYHHVVSDEHLPHIGNLYPYKNVKQFTDDLDFLLNNYQPVHPDTILSCINNKEPLPQNSFLLSFDDGFREVADVIAPILLKKGVPAIFFVNPSFIDNRELFYRCKLSLVIEAALSDASLAGRIAEMTGGGEHWKQSILKINYNSRSLADSLGAEAGISFDEFLKNQRPFLTVEQLVNLHKQGFTIGAHSMDHPHYGLLNMEEQIKQTTDSVQQVRNWTGSCSYFSFPHEDKPVRKEFFKMIGKQPALFFGTRNQAVEPGIPILHRFNAENPEVPISRSIRAVQLYRIIRRNTGSSLQREA